MTTIKILAILDLYLNKIRNTKDYRNHKERAVEYMIVKTTAEAWEAANKMLPTDYQKDEESSQRAGYPIYRSTAVDHYNFYICDLNDRLEVNMNGESVNIWIREEEQGEDVEVTVIVKTGETRTYTTYAAYRKDFRFFWSSGKTNEYEDGTEKHFEKIIQALRMVNEDEAKIESHRNGLTTVFTFRKFR